MVLRKNGLLEQVDSEYNTIFVEKQNTFISLNFGYRPIAIPSPSSILQTRAIWSSPIRGTCSLCSGLGSHEARRLRSWAWAADERSATSSRTCRKCTADVAELDPAVIALAQKYFGVEANDRLHINNKDGRVFLNQTKDKFDVILLDAYRGPFVPFHLTTQEFYRLVKSRLNAGGVVAQNVEPTTMFFDSAYATMKSVLRNVDAIEASGNIVLVAYSGEN